MRVLFAGSPAIAVPALESLVSDLCRKEGIVLVGVLTNPDTLKGRHRDTLQPTEVGEAAARILRQEPTGTPFPILKPLKLDPTAREEISLLKPDLLVSFAYGHIFGPKFLALFPLGGINIHPSLLPKYRGPSPIQAAIVNREKTTGITIQTLAEKMDAGDILTQEQFELAGEETTESLGKIMADKAAVMLPEVLKNIKAGTARPEPQDHSQATYCSLVTKEEAVIDWNNSAQEIEAKIRAFYPWPVCRTIHNGRELLLLEAAVKKDETNREGVKPGLVIEADKKNGILVQTGDGILVVRKLQYQMKKVLMWQDFLNGVRGFAGSLLGE